MIDLCNFGDCHTPAIWVGPSEADGTRGKLCKQHLDFVTALARLDGTSRHYREVLDRIQLALGVSQEEADQLVKEWEKR